MPSKAELRDALRANLADTLARVNTVLAGTDGDKLEAVLKRIGRGQQFPHWYDGLKTNHTAAEP